MTYEQNRKIRELAEYLPLLSKLNAKIEEIYASINEIELKISKRGPTPGLADLKKRVESLEDAISRRD